MMFGAGASWLEYLDNLLPIILVVAIGLLTLLKRFFEKTFRGETRPSSSRKRGSRPRKDKVEPPPEPSVFEEMKKYFELIEGKPAPKTPPGEPGMSPLTEGLAPPPPQVMADVPPSPAARNRSPVEISDPFDLVADRDDDILVTPEELGRGVSPDTMRLREAMTVSGLELRRGSGPSFSRKRSLDRVRLGRGRNRLREAFLWHEILGNPFHKHRR